uniref:60S ribosomal protein L6 n=1 Tax=Hirondellea gigas TaxID=1518452 RepID=A0A2P2IA42_9CRUS
MAIRGSRNHELGRGVVALSRTAMQRKRSAWRHRAKAAKKPEKKERAPCKLKSEPRFYRCDDVKRPLRSRKKNIKPTRLRPSITPGTVLILIAGRRFKGKRVVFLKQLDSGLLLVTGPYAVNGVPLRRVNQVYVIATSLKVDVSAADCSEINDSFFARASAPKKEDSERFFATEQVKSQISDEKKETQKKIDGSLIKAIGGVSHLKGYLRSRFTLKRGQYPHEMKF